ncbi:hypothetical protein JCM3770_002277 [Rhodotorula araucariae]
MSHATPIRRSSHSDLTSPPPSFSRRVSAVSSVAGTPSVAGSERRRRTRLRDYYGLAAPPAARDGDAGDLDAPDPFDPDSYFRSLSSTASLPDLLKREIDLLNEIRELDGERQSLVYNHHHELIDASDTIRKMKGRAEALDTSLDSLKTSFQSISQLSASLAPPVASSPPRSPPRRAPSVPAQAPQTPTRVRLDPLPESPDASLVGPDSTPTASRRRSASTAAAAAASAAAAPIAPFAPLVHLPALLALPVLLRALLGAGDKARADSLWGSWEPALHSWEDGGVEGAREIGIECREVLRMQRRMSISDRTP